MNASELNVFVPDCGLATVPPRDGPLAGCTFGLKDMFDLAGVPTGAGNPDWRRTHPVPTRTAPAAAMLLDAGAELVGKTITDELAWDLDGQNCHYGTPVNVAAPGRLPGGSSSGSAAATAARLCDVALGTDTGGSVRLPASYCGVYGIRPTHGRVSDDGVVPLAPSFDTVGWFARDPLLLRAVGRVLFGGTREPRPTQRLLIADDLFALAYPQAREALRPWLERLGGLGLSVEHVTVSGPRAAAWREAFRTIQSHEAWRQHGDWIDAVDPCFGTDIEHHLEQAAELSSETVEEAQAVRAEARRRMDALMTPGTLLVLPAVPGIAPRLDVSEEEHDDFRDRAHAMLCPAGLAGMPQVAMPLARLDGCPLGLSALAAQGEDEALLEWAVRFAEMECGRHGSC